MVSPGCMQPNSTPNCTPNSFLGMIFFYLRPQRHQLKLEKKSLHSANEAAVFPPLPKAWFGAALPRLMNGELVGWAISLFLSTDTKKHTNKDT